MKWKVHSILQAPEGQRGKSKQLRKSQSWVGGCVNHSDCFFWAQHCTATIVTSQWSAVSLSCFILLGYNHLKLTLLGKVIKWWLQLSVLSHHTALETGYQRQPEFLEPWLYPISFWLFSLGQMVWGPTCWRSLGGNKGRTESQSSHQVPGALQIPL